MNTTREVAALRQLTVKQLQVRYLEVFGEQTRSGNKDFLWKRIIWRMQAVDEGDLSERARRRAEELANDADLRVRRPSDKPQSSSAAITQVTNVSFRDRAGLPMPGTILTRPYNGQVIRVTVLDSGFEYQGDVYRSLSSVAKAITGAHWNGNYFFGLKGKGEE